MINYTRIALITLVVGLAFGMGFKTAQTRAVKQQMQAVSAAVEKYQASLMASQKVIDELEIEKDRLAQKTRTIIKEVPIYVSDEKDSECAPSDDVVRLLNAARDPDLPTASALPDETNTAPADIGFRDLVESEIDTAYRYNQMRLQCNTLIQWIKNNQQ